MSFWEFLAIYGSTLVVFGIADAVWLGVLAKDFYAYFLKKKMAEKPNWYAAVAFYLLFILGLVYFAVAPGIDNNDPIATAINASLYGLFTYVTYGLTNLATLKGWPARMTAVDIAWGVVACFSSGITVFVLFNVI